MLCCTLLRQKKFTLFASALKSFPFDDRTSLGASRHPRAFVFDASLQKRFVWSMRPCYCICGSGSILVFFAPLALCFWALGLRPLSTRYLKLTIPASASSSLLFSPPICVLFDVSLYTSPVHSKVSATFNDPRALKHYHTTQVDMASTTPTSPRKDKPPPSSPKWVKPSRTFNGLRIDPRLKAPKGSRTHIQSQFETAIDREAIVAYPVVSDIQSPGPDRNSIAPNSDSGSDCANHPSAPAQSQFGHDSGRKEWSASRCGSPTPSTASSDSLSTPSICSSDFSASALDEIICPSKSKEETKFIKLFLDITSPSGSIYSHTILATPSKPPSLLQPSAAFSQGKVRGQSSVPGLGTLGAALGLSSTFVGILRTMHADRPYFDPSGPPVWTASFSPLYEICETFYAQRFSCPAVASNTKTKGKQTSLSMLFIKRVVWLGEVCSVGVKPPPSRVRAVGSEVRRAKVDDGLEWRKVPVFEENGRYADTGFEPLEGPRALYMSPDDVRRCEECETFNRSKAKYSYMKMYPGFGEF